MATRWEAASAIAIACAVTAMPVAAQDRPLYMTIVVQDLAGLSQTVIKEAETVVTQILEEEFMLPAIGQGALGIVCRENDAATREQLAVLDHTPTHVAVTAERGLLSALEGSCKVPIAGHAILEGGRIALRGLVANLEGTIVIKGEATGEPEKAHHVVTG